MQSADTSGGESGTPGEPGGESGTPGEPGSLPGEEGFARWRRAGDEGRLSVLGQRLRELGLTESAVRHRFGVHAISHAPLRVRARPAARHACSRQRSAAIPPAALLVELFVAGEAVPLGLAQRRLGAALDELLALGLVSFVDLGVDSGADSGAGMACEEESESQVRAAVALLPVGEALVASDRVDRLRGRDTVLVADDSAFHLIGVMPGRGSAGRALRWLDVGTGSAILPLACPGIAAETLGTDIHPRAIAMAELGIGLSGARSIAVGVADLLAGAGERGPWDLITFNAPIPSNVVPGGAGERKELAPRYCVGDANIVHRFWREAGAALAPGGRVLAHSWQPAADYPAVLGLPGQVTALRYTPPGYAPAFGVTEWRPDGPSRQRLIEVKLTPSMPHLCRAALDQEPA